MEAEGIELPSAILAARLLILTGCRLNEIMTLKWAYVDLAERVLRLPDSKSGAKVVHLGQPAVELLRDAQRIDGNPWVIAGTLTGKRLSDLQPFWQRVRARALRLAPGLELRGRRRQQRILGPELGVRADVRRRRHPARSPTSLAAFAPLD